MTAIPATIPATEHLIIRSDLLGTFSTRAENVIQFSDGLLGFEECHRFALVRAGAETLFWLQSIDYSGLVFLLVDPFSHFSDYAVDVGMAEGAELNAPNPADVAVLAIVTLPAPGAAEPQPTANLQGPVAINMRTRRGKQIICADADWGVRVPLSLEGVRH